MMPSDVSFELGLPRGSVWIISVGDDDQGEPSLLAVRAVGAADVVIQDPRISGWVLDFVQPPRSFETVLPHQATERVINLALNGWRVVHLVGNSIDRAIETANRCAERSIPFRILRWRNDQFIEEKASGAEPHYVSQPRHRAFRRVRGSR